MLSRSRSTTGSTRTSSRSSEPGRRSTQAHPPDRDAPGEQALRDAAVMTPSPFATHALGASPARPRGACRAPRPRTRPSSVSSRATALETSGPTSGAAPPAAGAAGAAVVAAAAAAAAQGRPAVAPCSGASWDRPAAPSWWWSSCRPAPRSSTGRWRSGRRRWTPGRIRRRTTDWRSVTCSMRPTRPPEVITGMPTCTPLRLPWLMVIVWSKFDGGPEIDLGLDLGRSSDRVGRPNSDLSSWFSYTTASAAIAAPVLGLELVAQVVVLAASGRRSRVRPYHALRDRAGRDAGQAAHGRGDADEPGARAVDHPVAPLIERRAGPAR